MATQESDDDLLSGSDELLIDTGSSDDEEVDLEDITTEDEEPARDVAGGEDDEEDDEDEDDWDSDDKEEEEEEGDEGPAAGPSQAPASDSSDCDMDCDRCPICLARLRDQDVGTPEGCDHSFCLECIQEWAKNVNTCPVDRQPFHLIFARNSLDGVVCRKIEVKDRRLELEEEAVVDLTYCEVCGHATREDRLLLCDGCDLGYHCECLDPPLDSVPVGEWFCPNCSATAAVKEEADTRPLETRAQRRIGRTIVSERVRATIQQNRAQSATSSVRRGSTVRRRKKTKRRKQKRRSTSKGNSKLTSSDGKKRVKRRRRRRKTRKTCRTKDSVTPKTVKSRLAGRLGIAKPPAGRTIPVKAPVRSGALTVQRDIGIAPLTIMAGRDDLDPDWGESDLAAAPRTSGGGGATVQMARARCILNSRYTKAAMNSWRPIPRPHLRKIPENQLQCTMPFDLLGDILAGQDRMNTVTERVKIHRDGSLEVKPPEHRTSSRNQRRDLEPNDTETTPTSSEGVDQRPPGGSGTTDSTQNAAAVSTETDGGQCDMDGDCDGEECESGSGATELVVGGAATSTKSAAEKKCDEKTLKTAAEDKADKSKDTPESDKDISDDSRISCEGQIDDDMMIHFDDDVDVDSDSAFNVGGDTALNSDKAINVDSDIALNVDTTTADEKHATSNDGSCVSDDDKQEPSDKECAGNEGSPARETHVDQAALGVVSEKANCGDNDHEIDVEMPKAKRRSSVSVGQLYSSDEGGSDQEVAGEGVHELAGSGEEELTGSVGSEERTESLAVLTDDDEGVATATNEAEPADETRADSAHYENISEVEDEEPTLEDGEESGEESDDVGTYDGHGSASMSHIMVPISELPRIPKKRNAEKVRLPTDGESPHSGVLERLNRPDKVDRYPRWEKRERKEKSERDRRRSESGGSDMSVERPKEERRDSAGESRRRHRNHSRSSSREHSSHHYSKSTKHRRSHRRSRTPDRDRSHRRRDRSHERSRDRTRIMSRVHARSRSRSPRYRDETRSNRDETRSNRDETRSNRDEMRSNRDETRSNRDEMRSNRDETRSNRDETRLKRDRSERAGKSRHKTDTDDYKGSANIFSRSLKDAGKDAEFGSHRFKLQRNSFKEFTPSEIAEPRKRSDKIDKYGDRYLSSGRKNVYMEDNRIKVNTLVEDLHDDSSGSSSDVIIIESDTEEKNRDARKTKKSKTISDKPKVKSSVGQTSGGAVSGASKPPEDTKGSKSSSKGRLASSRSPTNATVKGKETRPPSPSKSPGEERKSRPRSPDRMAGMGRLTESWSSVSSEARPTRSPDREPREQRLSRSRSPVEGRLARSPVPTEERLPRSPDRVPSLGQLFQTDSIDSCYDPCHPTDSLSLSPPEDPPQPTAPFPSDEVLHPSLLHMPMIPVDPRTVPPPMSASMIIPPMPPHMPFPGMLAPGVRPPPPFLINNHLMGMDQFPSRLNWQPIAAMQMMQQARHLVPVMRNGIPMAPPPSESFVMPTGPPPAREHLGAIFRPPLPPMPPASDVHNFVSTMKTSRQSPGTAFKVPFPPAHTKVMFSLSSGNHGDTKAGSESNEVVDMDVSSPLSDDLLESFSPPPFIDDDDSRGGQGTKRKDELPGSAADMDKQEKYLRKLNRQERVVEEVKLAIKPYYAKGRIDKDEYKDIMRKAVPKICHSKSGNINPLKIRSYVEAYVSKVQQLRKYRQKNPRDNVNGHKRRHSRK